MTGLTLVGGQVHLSIAIVSGHGVVRRGHDVVVGLGRKAARQHALERNARLRETTLELGKGREETRVGIFQGLCIIKMGQVRRVLVMTAFFRTVQRRRIRLDRVNVADLLAQDVVKLRKRRGAGR